MIVELYVEGVERGRHAWGTFFFSFLLSSDLYFIIVFTSYLYTFHLFSRSDF